MMPEKDTAAVSFCKSELRVLPQNPERLGQEWVKTLTAERYDTMDAQLYAFFKKHADKKGFTQSVSEVLAAFEDKVPILKWNEMMKRWFP